MQLGPSSMRWLEQVVPSVPELGSSGQYYSLEGTGGPFSSMGTLAPAGSQCRLFGCWVNLYYEGRCSSGNASIPQHPACHTGISSAPTPGQHGRIACWSHHTLGFEPWLKTHPNTSPQGGRASQPAPAQHLGLSCHKRCMELALGSTPATRLKPEQNP